MQLAKALKKNPREIANQLLAELPVSVLVANAAPADLRGTAYGFFNLMSGLAMLLASVVAGGLWQRFGAPTTFGAGGLFCGLAMLGLLARRRLAVAP